jgi:hypothetical protein
LHEHPADNSTFGWYGLASLKSGLPASYPPEVPSWVDPERLSGAPCFKGTRVPLDSLFTNLESGLSLDEKRAFPTPSPGMRPPSPAPAGEGQT